MELRIFAPPSEDYSKALALRYEVLRKPLGLQFTETELEKDKHDFHFGLFENGQLLCCLTLSDCGSSGLKMRQVAVIPDMQGKGLGTRLCAGAEQWALKNGFEKIFCHAREPAVPFYKRMGYRVCSDCFSEVGIPHFRMEKVLTAN